MAKNYTDIKEKLQIEIDVKTEDGLAHLTHCFQIYKNAICQALRARYYKDDFEILNDDADVIVKDGTLHPIFYSFLSNGITLQSLKD